MTASKSTRPDGWFSRTDMARIFGVTVQAFDQSIRKYAAAEHTKKHGRQMLFYARGVLEAWAIGRFGRAATPGEDDLFSGADSPNLEEYRKWRAQSARLDYEERAKQLIERDQVARGLAEMASILRKAGERLDRRFGRAALDIMDKALDDFGNKIESIFTEPDDAAADEPDRGRVPQDAPRRKAAKKKKHAAVRGKRGAAPRRRVRG